VGGGAAVVRITGHYRTPPRRTGRPGVQGRRTAGIATDAGRRSGPQRLGAVTATKLVCDW
jgi:hypothetical protein